MKKIKRLKKIQELLDEYNTEMKSELERIRKEHQKLIFGDVFVSSRGENRLRHEILHILTYGEVRGSYRRRFEAIFCRFSCHIFGEYRGYIGGILEVYHRWCPPGIPQTPKMWPKW